MVSLRALLAASALVLAPSLSINAAGSSGPTTVEAVSSAGKAGLGQGDGKSSSNPVTHEDIPAWVITLDRTPLRYSLFKASSYAFDVFPRLVKFGATDGLTLDLDTDVRIAAAGRVGIAHGQRSSHSGLATRGMAGLYISHVDAWRAFLATGDPIGIVFEDDAVVQRDAGLAVDAVLSSMPDPEEWDLWLLGVVHVLEQRPPSRIFGPGWTRVTNWFGTQAYALTRRGAERLLAHAYPMTSQIDAYMAQMSALGEVVTVYRSDGLVNFPQFGVLAGTTVQQSYCDTCDMPPTWKKAVDELSWRRTGISTGLLASIVPWRAVWATIAALCAFLPCARCSACCRRKDPRDRAPSSPSARSGAGSKREREAD